MSVMRKKKIGRIENEYVEEGEKGGIGERRKGKVVLRGVGVFGLLGWMMWYLMMWTLIWETG
ncbi:hypothetical protein, partial [Cytobacillus oceanisediminis]|uniref:hypothetical protein n=1 Tax=Cytobacillus oceanisediminis TaxID=665099 RepID=UPI0011A61196